MSKFKVKYTPDWEEVLERESLVDACSSALKEACEMIEFNKNYMNWEVRSTYDGSLIESYGSMWEKEEVYLDRMKRYDIKIEEVK